MVPEFSESHLPAALQTFNLANADEREDYMELHAGALCPECNEGYLDYDGLLNLTCAACGFTTGGGGGCT